jgi:hypothetical protein
MIENTRHKKELPPCPPGKIRNPVSRRCVNIDGKIGKDDEMMR